MKKPLFLVVLLAVVATLSSFLFAEGGYQVGDKAADFKLKNVDGKLVSLAGNSAAKGYIVVFTCNTCPYAKAYEDRIIALHQKYAPQGYPVVAINPNDPQIAPGDSYAEMQKQASSKKYPFAYVFDESQEVARTYGATRTPHVYVLQRTGAADFKVAYIGAIDNNTEDAKAATAKYVEQALADLMAGKAATTSATKAVGCTIKWKKKA
ncbi:thioredoxin family protein [Hymenobacter koreensis]|uniref:Thioredoxin family protein n=1 Tax=Hymenobacter koreensis TaxID=1084523 RepID=A0ABP8IUS3_9BACT